MLSMSLSMPSRGAGVRHLPDEVTFEDATFWPLTTSAVMWSWSSGIRPGDALVILGGGLIGKPLYAGHADDRSAADYRC